MKRFFNLLAALIAAIGQMNANEITVSNVTIPQGGQQQVQVQYALDAADGYVGYAFKLNLPDGVSIVDYELDEGNADFNVTLLDDSFGALPKSTSVVITGTTGTLLSITLQADAGMVVGSDHSVDVTNIMLTSTELSSVYLEDTQFTITISEPIDSHILLDELSTTPPVSATGVDVRVRRTIDAGTWSTICLPFGMTAEQVTTAFGSDVEIGDFAGCDVTTDGSDNVTAIEVNFTSVDAIEANHPYIIKVSSPVTEFTAEGVDLEVVAEPAVDRDEEKVGRNYYYNSFVGTYVSEFTVPEECLFLSGNEFWYSTGNTKMKAYRGYFAFKDLLASYSSGGSSLAPAIMQFNNNTTGVTSVKQMSKDSDAIYNLNGQKVEKAHKGIYIQHGKKVVIK